MSVELVCNDNGLLVLTSNHSDPNERDQEVLNSFGLIFSEALKKRFETEFAPYCPKDGDPCNKCDEFCDVSHNFYEYPSRGSFNFNVQ